MTSPESPKPPESPAPLTLPITVELTEANVTPAEPAVLAPVPEAPPVPVASVPPATDAPVSTAPLPDTSPETLRRHYILWHALLLHLIWGICLVVSTGPIPALRLVMFYEMLPDSRLIGSVLLLIAGLAFSGIVLLHIDHRWRLLLLLPQQLLLLYVASGSVGAIVEGTAANRLLLIVEQAPAILLAILHLLAILNGRLEKSIRLLVHELLT